MKITEDQFRSWAPPPSLTEQDKMNNAENAIRKAINSDKVLSGMDISIFAQGSYSTNTNVRLDSDVDICVCLNSTFFPEYPAGKTKEDYGNSDGTITFKEYKDMVEVALISYFDKAYVKRGNKAFDIHSNSYRVDADVIAAFAYRYYYENSQDFVTPTGTSFITEDGKQIYNWPKQAVTNGVTKRSNTGHRFKKIVRILKRLRNKMQDEKIKAADNIASFLIESMVWNVPENYFNHDEYTQDVRSIVAYCFNATLNDTDCKEFLEVNGIKYLFHSTQPWTRAQVHDYFSAVWDYLEFKN